MNAKWKQLGGQAAIGLAVVGFLLIFLGWNGAATYDREPAQLPYVISGGIAGLAVVVIAAALMVVNAQRQDRAALLNGLAELKEAMERLTLVSAGASGNGATSGRRPQDRVARGSHHGDDRGGVGACVQHDEAIEGAIAKLQGCRRGRHHETQMPPRAASAR